MIVDGVDCGALRSVESHPASAIVLVVTERTALRVTLANRRDAGALATSLARGSDAGVTRTDRSAGSPWASTMALLAAALWLGAGVAMLTCCAPSTAPDGGALEDAGRDGGSHRDAGRDGGMRRDAGHDAGPSEPVWLPLEGLPEGCQLSMAADPEEVAGPLVFQSCPDMAGCRELVVDWTSEQMPRFLALAGDHDGTHGYFTFGRGAESGWTWIVFARDDGRILAVIRSPMPTAGDPIDCYFGRADVRGTRAAMTIQTTYGSSAGESVIGLLDWTDEASFRVLATLTPAELGPENFVQQIELGDGFVTGQVVLRNDIVRVGFDGSVDWVTGSEEGSPTLQTAARSGLFYMTLGPGSGLWTADLTDV